MRLPACHLGQTPLLLFYSDYPNPWHTAVLKIGLKKTTQPVFHKIISFLNQWAQIAANHEAFLLRGIGA